MKLKYISLIEQAQWIISAHSVTHCCSFTSLMIISRFQVSVLVLCNFLEIYNHNNFGISKSASIHNFSSIRSLMNTFFPCILGSACFWPCYFHGTTCILFRRKSTAIYTILITILLYFMQVILMSRPVVKMSTETVPGISGSGTRSTSCS